MCFSEMHFEVPDCKRCLFCVPLRYGILIFGYLNLMFTLLILSLEVWMDYGSSLTSYSYTSYRGVGIFSQMWLPILLYSLEIIFNVILLVGAHTKQTRFIRIYYYYGMMTMVAAFLTFVYLTLYEHYDELYRSFYFSLLEFCVAFSALVLQAYLLLLIRTELQKLKYQQGQFSYVNHMSEVLLEPPIFGNGRNPL